MHAFADLMQKANFSIIENIHYMVIDAQQKLHQFKKQVLLICLPSGISTWIARLPIIYAKFAIPSSTIALFHF